MAVTVLHNDIIIDASAERIWQALAQLETLEKYDPTVKRSVALSEARSGAGARRKVEMRDGKNWFEEQCTVYQPQEALTYELTACSFPIHNLKHSYRFEKIGNQVKVSQVMEYQMKFGLLGNILDVLLVRRQSDKGIKQFFKGLKSFTEKA